MNAFYSEYLSSLHFDELDYSSVEYHKQKFLSGNLSLVIPKWNFVNNRILEIYSTAPGLVIEGFSRNIKVVSERNESRFANKELFDVLQDIESFWVKSSLSAKNFFYTVLLSYEASHLAENVATAPEFYGLPLYYITFPGNSLLIDHTSRKIHSITFNGRGVKISDNYSPVPPASTELQISESRENYLKKIEKIKRLISEGEVYQVNYTIRFSKPNNTPGIDFFNQLYKINNAPFAVYQKLPGAELISNSPERFFYLSSNKVVTQPIKGTIPRGNTQEKDLKNRNTLLSSEKDIAELSMIVDLLRNDISKVCRFDSVNVLRHKEIHRFENVYHLISTIEGILRNNVNYIHLLKAAYPGGSITGCPKIAAMQYISRLEQHNRSFYTGSFLLRFPQRDETDSNILIRTAIKIGTYYHFQAGGGIVIDSDPADEYQECLAKASSFLKII